MEGGGEGGICKKDFGKHKTFLSTHKHTKTNCNVLALISQNIISKGCNAFASVCFIKKWVSSLQRVQRSSERMEGVGRGWGERQLKIATRCYIIQSMVEDHIM